MPSAEILLAFFTATAVSSLLVGLSANLALTRI